jgi:hypothetical protein
MLYLMQFTSVPCCRPQLAVDIFLPAFQKETSIEGGDCGGGGGASGELLPLTQQSSTLSTWLTQQSAEDSEFVPESQESPVGSSAPNDATPAPPPPPPPSQAAISNTNEQLARSAQRPQPSKLLDLGADLPDDMDDQVPYALQRRLEKCHLEGFVECVKEHVAALAKCSRRKEI